jgi:hypothetical protein
MSNKKIPDIPAKAGIHLPKILSAGIWIPTTHPGEPPKGGVSKGAGMTGVLALARQNQLNANILIGQQKMLDLDPSKTGSFNMLARIFIIIAAAFMATTAHAENLTEKDAGRFIATLDEVTALGKELEKNELNVKPQPMLGERFQPFKNAVVALKAEQPANYKKLDGIVSKQGFTPEAWGETGDKVMVAYIAAKLDKESPGAMKEMENMDPAMLDMMPAQVRDQMKTVMAMVQTVKDTPAEDKKAIKPHMAELEKKMEQ